MKKDFPALTGYLDSLHGRYGIPACDMVIYQGHELAYRHMAGYADAARTRPVSEDDLYNIYSATKVVTCTAVMQLVEKGRVSLADPVSKFLPSFGDMYVDTSFDLGDVAGSIRNADAAALRPARNEILVRHLLTMGAGLTYDYLSDSIREVVDATGGSATTLQGVDAIARMPLAYEPGTRWLYSFAHDVLGALVEVAGGMRFSEYLRKNICGPLGIASMYFTAGESESARMSQQYRYSITLDKFIPVPPANHYALSANYESGGAGLICTAGDYALFVDALCNHGVGRTGCRILEAGTVDMMRADWLNEAQFKDFSAMFNRPGYSYGLGVRTLVDNAHSKSPVGEFGWDGAAGAYLIVDMENRLCAFYVQHTLDFGTVYSDIHPALRDIMYQELFPNG